MDVSTETTGRLGNMLGTPIVGGTEWFTTTYGPAAAASVVAELPAVWRSWVRPNSRALGLLGAKRYPYAFIGALVGTMAKVVRAADPDLFIDHISAAGIDAAIGTGMRVLLRYGATPASLATRAQESWDMFHDSGLVRATVTAREYVSETTAWAAHDPVVCKICLYVRKRIIARAGMRNVVATRDRCQSWGHDRCVHRIRWD